MSTTEAILPNWEDENPWEEPLDDLRARLEDYFEEVDSDVDLTQYSSRKLGNGDYVISTPGKVYLLENSIDGSLGVHERGKEKEGYSHEDMKIEEMIEEELSP